MACVKEQHSDGISYGCKGILFPVHSIDFTWSRWLSLLVVRAEEPAATGPRQERLDRLGNNAV
jgi:hypothetical protein